MTEAAKVFYSTNAERKRNGRGDRNKKRQGGRIIRFPSDYMKQMDGEVKKYQLGKPMTWTEYSELPEDLKETYLRSIVKKYNATPGMLAEMFLRNRNVCAFEAKRLKINTNPQRGRVPTEIMDRWHSFLSNSKEEPETEEQAKKPTKEKMYFANDKMADICKLLSAFEGSGVKITKELTL